MFAKKTDEELMLAYQLGEEGAFTELYRRHAPRVLGFLRRRLPTDAAARDVFQSTFLKLHQCRAQYDARYPFAPWLFTICRCELLDAQKRPHRRRELLASEPPEPPLILLPETPEVALGQLPAAQRTAVELRFEKDFSYEEIAERLQTSPANARQLVSRALKWLRGKYGK